MYLVIRYFTAHLAKPVLSIMLVMLVLSTPLIAQQKKADSLLSVLKAHQVKDSVYLNRLNKIVFAYVPVNRDNALNYADKAIILAKLLNIPLAEAEANLNKGLSYSYTAESLKALGVDQLALNQFERLNDKTGIVRACLELSLNNYNLGKYLNSLQYAQLAVDVSKQAGNDKLWALSLTKLGNTYTMLSDYPKAINCFLQQLKIFEKEGDRMHIAKAYGNIGLVYYYLKKYPEALAYSNKCLHGLEEVDDKLWVSASLNNIGGIYFEMGNYAQVINYNKRALIINKQLKSPKGIGNDLMDMGAAYAHMKSYVNAFKTLQQAATLYDSLGAKNNSAIALGHLAMLYTNAPDTALVKIGVGPALRFNKALQTEQQALQLACETNSVSTQADQWKNMSLIYEKQGNYKEALKSYRSYTALSDSISNDKKRTEITRLGMQYEFDKKEANLKTENAKKQAEVTRQKVIKNAAILTATILLLSAATSFFFYKRRKDAREKQKEAELRAQVSETEMKALRAQLNPHFIFNSLNSIGDYVARNDKETADIYLSRFAKLMRMILENSEHETISLADDLKALELYIQLEALRLGHKLLYTIDVDADIDTELTLVPPMLLQPFVENSIWHGILPKDGNGKITVRVKKTGDIIEYLMEDNGIGRKRSAELKKNKIMDGRRSFGIKVIQSRINNINNAQQAGAGVELTDLDEGTKVSIKLPHDLKF